MSELAPRPLMPEDASAARALIDSRLRDTPYLARHVELLESALQFEDPEFMALLADGAPLADGLAALVLFGTVAGARSVVKVHGAVARDDHALDLLLDAVRDACARSDERLVLCELPDDGPFVLLAASLERCGFHEEGRVPDFVRDGVALRLLVWRP